MEKYFVEIIRRDGLGQTSDDYHATVTRESDNNQLVFISRWRWLLKLRTRRRLLEREFRYYKKRRKKLDKVDQYIR
jgi:hypothetical protein